MPANTLQIVLEAKNLTAPSFAQLKKDLEASDVTIKKVSGATQQAGKEIQGAFGQASQAGTSFASGVAQGLGVAVPLSAAAAATAVVAFGASSVKSFADYEKAMRAVNTVTGITGAESQKVFEANSRQVRELAVRMGVDATGAAQALYEVLSAGIPQGKAAFDVLEVGSKAAVGGLTTTKVAVDGLTSILNGYKLGAADAQRVSDQMFATVRIGKLNYEELAGSVGAVVPIAAAAGVTFKEVGGFIANMTLSGNSASVSANSLRQVITSIIKPTDEAREAAKFLGLDFSETALRSKGLAGFLKEVETATGGSSEAMGVLFSDIDGLKGVISSIGPNMDGFEKAIDGVTNSAGAADDAFGELNQSSARQWEEMAAKANELKLQLGESLVEPLKNVITFVDDIGKSFGLWPSNVPSRDQIDRIIEMGTAGDKAAEHVNTLVKALLWIETNLGGKAGADAIVNRLVDQAQAAKLATAAEDRLADALRSGRISAGEYDLALTDLAKARGLVADAERQGTQLTEDAALAQVAAATAALETANTVVQASAQEVEAARKAGDATLRAKLDAHKEAQRLAKEAAAEAKRIADAAVRDEERRVEQVAKAGEDALDLRRRFTREVADVERDGLENVQAIRDRHDTDYNQSIVDAQDQQKRIVSQAAADVLEITQTADGQLLDTGREWNARRAEIVRENGDRRADIERDAEQRIAAIGDDWSREREAKVRDANDRRVDMERDLADRLSDEVADRERRLSREVEDARLAREERDEDRRLQHEDRGADKDDARKDATKDLAKAEAEFKKDSASETARYQATLREADDADARAKEEERHAEELAKLTARSAEEKARIIERRDERIAGIDEQEKHQVAADQRRDAREAQHAELSRTREREDFERGQQDQRDRQTVQLAAIEERQGKDLAALATTKQAELDRVTETKQKTLAALEERQTKDLEALRVAKQAELDKTAAKQTADLAAIEERKEKDIAASNDALVKKQAQIDAARETDFGKFKADLAKRFRDMEQQFGDSMGKLNALIPDRVAAFIGGAAGNVASASANLQAAATTTSSPQGDVDVSAPGASDSSAASFHGDGQTLAGQSAEVQQLFQDVYGDQAAEQWQREHDEAQNRGQGAGADDATVSFASLRPTSGLSPILERLGRALRINARLVGGDSRTLTGPPTPISAGASGAVSWAMGHVGSKEWEQMCERFVENAFGTTGRYPSAKAAAAALMTNAGGSLEGAPRSSLVFFRPDGSNGGFGHVGIALGGGQFVSATSDGVSVDGPSRYWSGLYQGHGLPRFSGGGVVPGLAGEEQQVIAHGGEVIFNPGQLRVLGQMMGSGGGALTAQDIARAIAQEFSRMTIVVEGDQIGRVARTAGRRYDESNMPNGVGGLS